MPEYRSKPAETLVEVCSNSDMQIDRQTWAQGRKTNRTRLVAGSCQSFPRTAGASCSFIR